MDSNWTILINYEFLAKPNCPMNVLGKPEMRFIYYKFQKIVFEDWLLFSNQIGCWKKFEIFFQIINSKENFFHEQFLNSSQSTRSFLSKPE